MVDPSPLVRVRDLTYAYPGGKPVLCNISFTLGAGETIGLIGPNGAGKTTLFLTLAGVLPVKSGSLMLAGLDPGLSADRKKLPAKIGIIFQNSDDQLFSSRVADDVAFGPHNLGLPREEVVRRVADALRRVGLEGFDDRVPYHLSGGEKRRAAIAGVLAMQPEILLLDEPSMFLDPRGRRELIGWLNAYGHAKIIASHDLEMILDTCTRVLVLDRGTIVRSGPTAEVCRDAEFMEGHGLEVPYRLR